MAAPGSGRAVRLALIGAGPASVGPRPSVNVVVEALPNPMPAKDYAVAADRLARTAFHNYTVIQESSRVVVNQNGHQPSID